ncbi:TetR family transcriptional regulator C-terminal domain-containing protein [Glutamicibacter sp.]|uniref:TetR/AcrR family transcriptional regulator n=1 Tax=Glutamicibacter sp. TaxID=1931995 RepID=UPI0028BF3625|nr:TetR family transcriptional regulator C-terminal domain-containing protein [Glutamicibacter sp.]
MPKIVDHDQRRREIVEVTWRFIARDGIDKLNLRDLAAAAGFANGGLKPYFPTKDSILTATFGYVAAATNARIEAGVRGREGLSAIEAFAHEVLPLDELRRDEARVAVHFWHMALGDQLLAQVNAQTMQTWRDMLDGWLVQLLGEGHPDARAARDGMINFMMGAQAGSVLDEEANSVQSLLEQLEHQLIALRRLAETIG